MGNMGIMSFISGEQGHMFKNEEGNRGTNVILGSREHKKLRFWFWETRKKWWNISGEQITSRGWPHYSIIHSTYLCCSSESGSWVTSVLLWLVSQSIPFHRNLMDRFGWRQLPSWDQARGREFRMIPGLCMKSLVRPSQRFWGTRDHAHFLSGNIGKHFKGTKLIFGNRERGNYENCF